MVERWWQLPGPASFVNRLGHSCLNGQNILVVIWDDARKGLWAAVHNRIAERRPLCVFDLGNVEDAKRSPMRLLHEFLGLPIDHIIIPDAKGLALAEAFQGHTVWIENALDETLPSWFSFLQKYQQACQALDEFNRGTICLVVPSHSANGIPKRDAALTVHRWQGVVSRLDTSVYASISQDTERVHPLLKRLNISIVSELALSDRRLADFLVDRKLGDLLDKPETVLELYANQQGWTFDTCKQPSWENGMLDEVEGNLMIHSAVLAVQGKVEVLQRRVWTAQVGVLFPALEQARMKLIDELRGYLRIPFDSLYETIEDYSGLELGHIWYQVKNSRLPREKLGLVRRLKEMRGQLAHLRPVPAAQIYNEQVLRYIGQ